MKLASFQDTREQTEKKVLVHLLSEIERNPSFTQRGLAGDLGIALGLMNQYLKRCITKGWVRASQVSPRRIGYFLTPEGFKEKSHMVKDYLSRSMNFFKEAKAQCEAALSLCQQNGWTTIGLVGEGDLADIAHLVARGSGLHLHTADIESCLEEYDAVLVVDILKPQEIYDRLKKSIVDEKILTLDLLHISRDRA